MKRTILTWVIGLTLYFPVSAQDQIITRDADTLNCYIINIEPPFITFKINKSTENKRIPVSFVHKYKDKEDWFILNNLNPNLYYPISIEEPPVNQELILGQKFRGGYVFYLDESKQHGLIAASADQASEATWGCSNEKIGASDLTYGLTNTKLIITNCGFNTAAILCAEFEEDGYTDWYLPAIDELQLLYEGRRFVPGIGAGDYCSSSEYAKGNNDCWAIHFAREGERFRYNKGFKYRVRAIRRF
jgi:hypothetical protein